MFARCLSSSEFSQPHSLRLCLEVNLKFPGLTLLEYLLINGMINMLMEWLLFLIMGEHTLEVHLRMQFYSLMAVWHEGKNRTPGVGQGFEFESWLHFLLFVWPLDNLFIIVLFIVKLSEMRHLACLRISWVSKCVTSAFLSRTGVCRHWIIIKSNVDMAFAGKAETSHFHMHMDYVSPLWNEYWKVEK